VEAHGVRPQDVEQVIADPASTTIPQNREANTEPRWKTIGKAAGKRIIAIWTTRGDLIVRPVTAWFESRPRKRQ
jgi:uncharacterized DUF497 family protein